LLAHQFKGMAAKKRFVKLLPTIEEFECCTKNRKVYLPFKTKQTQILADGDANAVRRS